VCRQSVIALAISLLAYSAWLLTGCGGESKPKPDREQVEQVVLDFFHDIAEDDVEAVCDKLNSAGRAQAIGRGIVGARPPKTATRDECVEDGAHVPLSYLDLPSVVEQGLLRVRKVEISGMRAKAITSVGALRGVQRLRETPDGWKIEAFNPMVRE
jgi:hypothetical protein